MHGHKWWELDVTYLTIRALALVGLATAVVRHNRHDTDATGDAAE